MKEGKIKIIYASISGNVELVSNHIGEKLKEQGFKVDLERAEKFGLNSLQGYSTLIFATSTWDHGEINPYFNKFLKDTQDYSFSEFKAAFAGLGDVRYEPVLFCKGIDILEDHFISRGGNKLGETLKINGEPQGQLGLVGEWVTKFYEFH